MSGKIYVGNDSGVAQAPEKIYIGNGSNQAVHCKIAYCGDSNGKAVEVWRDTSLPSTYQKVEYIYNTGATQWIDTGVKPNSDTRILIKFNQLEYYWRLDAYVKYYFFGCKKNAAFMRRDSSSTGDAYMRYEWGDSDSSATGEVGIYTFDINRSNGSTYKNDEHWFTSQSTFSATNNYYLFAYNNNGTAVINSNFSHYVYFFRVWQSRVMIRDMYPCYLKSNTQTVGMYDVINGQFYGNSGTGIFYKGPDID